MCTIPAKPVYSGTVHVPRAVLPLPGQSGRRVVRAGRRGAVRRWADGPITSLAELSLTPEHGAGYDATNHGRTTLDRLHTTLAALPVPCAADRPIALAVDVSHWLRPDAASSPERLLRHTYARGTAKPR